MASADSLTLSDLMPLILLLGGFASMCAVLTFLWRMLAAVVGMRQAFLDMAKTIGQKHPPEGLLGDIVEIKEQIGETQKEVAEQSKQLAVIESGVAARRLADKQHGD